MTAHRARGFTIVELLVVIAIIALLMGLLFSGMRGLKETSGESTCANNLRQLGTATFAYLATYKDYLPQVAVDDPFAPGERVINGTLFGGKRGQLPFMEIDQYGVDRRPLNAFLAGGKVLVDNDPSDGIDEDIPIFQCPLDRGQPASQFLPDVPTMYDFVGTSYTLNDHSIDNEDCGTLIPKRTGCGDDPETPFVEVSKPGGRMPSVADPTKCWMIGDLPIYNFNEGGDRGQRWHHKSLRCCLCFVDGHVAAGIRIREPQPTGAVGGPGPGVIAPVTGGGPTPNTTPDYTFLPSEPWDCDPCTDDIQPPST